MSLYKLHFKQEAEIEWNQLDGSIKKQFVKILARRLEQPRIPSAALHNIPNCYKIKLRGVGYRLIYQVDDDIITVMVIAVGKREDNAAYRTAQRRLHSI